MNWPSPAAISSLARSLPSPTEVRNAERADRLARRWERALGRETTEAQWAAIIGATLAWTTKQVMGGSLGPAQVRLLLDRFQAGAQQSGGAGVREEIAANLRLHADRLLAVVTRDTDRALKALRRPPSR